MISSSVLTLIIFSYVGILFAVAQGVERYKIAKGKSLDGAWIYALSLAVYHTSWTFYGSTGFAAENGLLYLSIYVGAVVGVWCWPWTIRPMINARNTFRLTSVADYISTRYNRSKKIAALVSLMAIIGIVPYIALQLRAIGQSFSLMTEGHTQIDGESSSTLLVLFLMLLFTIAFGARRLDSTERHEGMIAALVFECLIKLAAFIAIGLYVCFGVFNGFGDVFTQIHANNLNHLLALGKPEGATGQWLSLLALSFVAIHFLPRQFHVAVVENTHRSHIKGAMWMFPLYVVLINLFVIPIAAAGLLSDIPASQADFFALLLPMAKGDTFMAGVVFLGGFSAATGMVILTTVALATMASNHLLVPAIERLEGLGFLRAYLLPMRWLLIGVILMAAYGFMLLLSQPILLASIGILSFTAIFQLAVVGFGGLFWNRGNSMGALLSLLTGCAIWVITMLVPTLIEMGNLPRVWLTEGIWGIEWLKPQGLLGVDYLNPVAHCVFWSLLLNTLVFMFGSMWYHPRKRERTFTIEFMYALAQGNRHSRSRSAGLDNYIVFDDKYHEALNMLSLYMPQDKATAQMAHIAEDMLIAGRSRITIIELVEFHRMVEHVLAGSIGVASAHDAMESHIKYSSRESADLKAIFSHIVHEMKEQKLFNETPDSQDQRQSRGVNYGMMGQLQSKIAQLELELAHKSAVIERLEHRLEHKESEIFTYRVECQKAQQEARDLRATLTIQNGDETN
ncbi:MAG: hypothetical protein ACPGMR_01470 [Pontibacterium sp.]